MAMTLVVLHGWGQSRESWGHFADSFKNEEKVKVVVIDLPGFGKEPLVSDTWGILEYVKWTRNKIDTLAQKDGVVLLGHSFGGRVASVIASQKPSWLKGLILYAAPSLYRPSWSVQMKVALAKVAKQLGWRWNPWRNDELEQADHEGMGKIFRHTVRFDQTKLLPKITAPTLLIWGRDDDIVDQAIAQEMHHLIPQSQLVVLDDLGHNAHLENLALFYGTVQTFLHSL